MPNVLIYSSDSCGYCHKAKAFFKENGVKYTEKNVNADKEANREIANMGAKGVPVIIVDKEVIMGFDEKRLKELLGKLMIECPKCRTKMRLPRNKGILKATCPSCKEVFKADSNK